MKKPSGFFWIVAETQNPLVGLFDCRRDGSNDLQQVASTGPNIFLEFWKDQGNPEIRPILNQSKLFRDLKVRVIVEGLVLPSLSKLLYFVVDN